jgi:hypothetical protein
VDATFGRERGVLRIHHDLEAKVRGACERRVDESEPPDQRRGGEGQHSARDGTVHRGSMGDHHDARLHAAGV